MIGRAEEAMLRKIALAIWASTTAFSERQLDEPCTPDSGLAERQKMCWGAARAVLNALAGTES